MPKVSVIIPNYNHARFLEQRIRSVLDQTFADIEVILMDDASTDNSRDVISRFSTEPRVRVLLNDTNSGCVFKQWNKGFREAKGEYVWIAESDDYADPTFLETLVPKLDGNSSVGVAYCQSMVVDENGAQQFVVEQRRDHIDSNHWSTDFTNNGRDECARYFIFGSMICNASAALVRRSVIEKIGYAEEAWRIVGDWIFWGNVLLVSDIDYTARPLNYWRQHTGTVRENTTKNGIMISESIRATAYFAAKVDVPADVLERARAMRFHSWVCYNEECPLTLGQNRAVYDAARDFDPRVNRRIARYLPVAPARFALKWIRRQLNAARHQ